MTEFGKQYFPHWIRGRILVTSLAVLVVLAIALTNPSPTVWVLALLLAANVSASFVLHIFISRYGARLLYLAFLIDILGIIITIQYTHGISGGFGSAYILVALNCILLLGRSGFVRVAAMILLAIGLEIALDLAHVLPETDSAPFVVQMVGQLVLLTALLYTSYLVARTSASALEFWRSEKQLADTGRITAEQEQQRWALINNVALRIQESTTPQQVYISIGEELERVGLHSAILEWAEPEISFKIVHLSLGTALLEWTREHLGIDLNEVKFALHDKPELEQAIAGRTPVVIRDVFESGTRLFPQLPGPLLHAIIARVQAQTMLYAPMFNRQSTSGILVIWGSTLSLQDLAPYAALAQQAASALDKARLLTEQHKRAAQLELVSNISAQIMGAVRVEDVIQPLVRSIGERFGYPVVSIALIDPVHNELYVPATFTTIGDLAQMPMRQPLASGILGLVARTGQAYLARETRNDPHYFSPNPAQDPIRSELVIPLLERDRVMGVLDIESPTPDAFDEHDVTALKLLAEQVAGALSTSRVLTLEQKRAAHLAVVGEIAARAAAFSDPDAIVRTIVQLVQQRFGYHHVCLSLYDPVQNEMEQRAAAGPNAHLYKIGHRWNAKDGVIGLAARTRQTVYSGNLQSDPRYLPDPDKIANSALCVPLVSGKTVLGVLDVESQAQDAFDENDRTAMETLANQMAAALEKARSLQAERRRAAQLALVNRIASRTARLISTDQLVREATDMIHAQFGYYNVAVFVCDPGQPGARLVANTGALDRFSITGTTRLTRGIIAFVTESGTSYLCIDARNDPHYVSPFPSDTPDPVRSEISIPMRRGEQVLGVLDIQSQELRAFTPSDITALEALADQLAAALENARLFESEALRVAQLDSIRVLALKITAERDIDALLQSIVSSITDLVQAQGAALYIVDETRGDLVVRISYHLSENYVGYRLQMGEGMAGRVAQQREPMMIPNYAAWDKRSPRFNIDSLARMLSVPLKWQDRVLGVINLHRDLNRPLFNQEELRLANLFAAQAAIALENARLVTALQGRLQAQHTLSDLSASLLETTDPQAIIDRAAHAAAQALDVEIVALFLPDARGKLTVQAHAGALPRDLLEIQLDPDLHSIAGTAFVTRQQVVWSKADPEVEVPLMPLAVREDFYAGLAMPMSIGEHVVGVITINTRAERQFTPTEIQTLALLANQTATALERARYFTQLQRRVQELDLLFEGFRATASTLDPDQIIRRLIEQLVRALGVTSAFFMQARPSRNEWEQTHEYHAPSANAFERNSAVRTWQLDWLGNLMQALSRGVYIVQQDDPALAESIRTHMRANAVHTILRVPLLAASEIIGYLSLWDTHAPRAWTEDEIRFVQTMASQASAALINARLYQAAETHSRELHALYEASRLLNASLDVQTICQKGVDSLRDILGYHHVSIYFLEHDTLSMQVQRGYDTPFDVLPLDRGIIARAAQTRQLVFLPEVEREPGYLAALSNVESEIAVPLLVGERVLGVLNVETQKGELPGPGKRQLTEQDAQLLQTFANQFVVAMENARLFQETQQHLFQVRTLHAAAQAVNADLALDAVLEQVIDQFIVALDVDSCTISEFDAAAGTAITLLDRDPLPEARAAVGTQFAMSGAQLKLIDNNRNRAHTFRRDDPALHPDLCALLDRFHWRAVVFAPLIVKGEILGYVELGERKRARTFDAGELQLAESLAGQAAIAIQNARLYRDAQQRLQETETLYRFARELGATLDVQDLGKRALEAAARLTDFDIGEVSLVRERDGALVPVVLSGGLDPGAQDYTLSRGTGISGWVVEHGRAIRLGDVTRDPRYSPISPHIMSELCLPLRIGTRVIGVLNLEAKSPNAFDGHVEQLLSAFANQLAIAIENARLYEQTKRDAEVKAALLRELSHRVKNNLAAITSLLYMALDEPPETREQILNETLGRVQSMALAHALLARSGEARVNLLELGRQVVQDTVRNLAHPGVVVDTETDGEEVLVAARQTTTLALVLNELATNALRHGLDAGQNPHLSLHLRVTREQRRVHLELLDDGKGLQEPFDASSDAGLGLHLVHTLVEKDLHGQFLLERRGPWTCADIRFQLEEDVS